MAIQIVASGSGTQLEVERVVLQWALDFPDTAKWWREFIGSCAKMDKGGWQTDGKTMRMKMWMDANLNGRMTRWYNSREQRDCRDWKDDDKVISAFQTVAGALSDISGKHS